MYVRVRKSIYIIYELVNSGMVNGVSCTGVRDFVSQVFMNETHEKTVYKYVQPTAHLLYMRSVQKNLFEKSPCLRCRPVFFSFYIIRTTAKRIVTLQCVYNVSYPVGKPRTSVLGRVLRTIQRIRVYESTSGKKSDDVRRRSKSSFVTQYLLQNRIRKKKQSVVLYSKVAKTRAKSLLID